MSRLLGFLDALALSCQRSGSEGLWDCTPGEVLGSMQVQTVGGSSAGNLRPVVVSDVAHLPRSFSSAGISPLRSPTPVMLVGEEKGHEGDPDEDVSGGRKAAPMIPEFFEEFKSEIQYMIRPPSRAMVVIEESEDDEIEIFTNNEGCSILFEDNGPGIPSKNYEDVFKPFFTLDPSRNKLKGESGLGLTIARDIIRSHGGEIKLSHSKMGGLETTINLPL